MDGVIIDSEPLHLEVNKEIFSKLGISLNQKEYSKYIGLSNTDMWKDIISRYDLKDVTVSKLLEWQKKKNINHIKNDKLNLVPGIKQLLNKLSKTEVDLALASSSPPELINLVLDYYNFKKYFSVVESGENVKNGKPAPDLPKKVASKLEINPKFIIVIEDSHNGVLAAKKAGMKCIGYRNVNSGKQDLSQADLIVDNFNKISVESLNQL